MRARHNCREIAGSRARFGARRVSIAEYSPPHEEGWLRHQENFGEAHLSAADGVVAHTERRLVRAHPGRCSGHPSSRGGESPAPIFKTFQVLRKHLQLLNI